MLPGQSTGQNSICSSSHSYLFVIVVTVVLCDVYHDLFSLGVPSDTWSEGYPVRDSEYADDMLPLGLTIPQLQSILAALAGITMEYGMNKVNTEP